MEILLQVSSKVEMGVTHFNIVGTVKTGTYLFPKAPNGHVSLVSYMFHQGLRGSKAVEARGSHGITLGIPASVLEFSV